MPFWIKARRIPFVTVIWLMLFKLKVNSEISLQMLNGVTRNQSSLECDLIISDWSGQSSFVLPRVFSAESIPVKRNSTSKNLYQKCPHLCDICFNELHNAKVSLLIGANTPEMLCIKSYRKGLPGIPVAVKTPIGLSLLGLSLSPSLSTNCKVNFVNKSVMAALNN